MRVIKIAIAAIIVAAVVGTSNAQNLGAFRLVKNSDPMTDADRSFILTEAINSTGRGSQKASLAWRCMSDGLNVAYYYGSYMMGSDSRITVQYRLGEAPATPARSWDMSTNRRAAFVPMNEVAQFTKQAESIEKITLRVTDRDGDTRTHVFSLDGLSSALQALSCHRPAS